MRYTNLDAMARRSGGVRRDDIPLWTYHIQRLQEAHTHFAQRDGETKWGEWPGGEAIWEQVKMKLDTTPEGDWRVCPPLSRIVRHSVSGNTDEIGPAVDTSRS